MKPSNVINQLVFIIVSGAQAGELMERLSENRFYFTKIDTSGGVIQEPTICLLIGLNHERTTSLLELVRQCCQPYRQFIPTHLSMPPYYGQPPMIEAQLGGAILHVLDVERFEQL